MSTKQSSAVTILVRTDTLIIRDEKIVKQNVERTSFPGSDGRLC